MPMIQKFVNSQLNRFQTKVLLRINLLTTKKRKKSIEEKKVAPLPNEIWAKVFEYCAADELMKLRRVCKDFDAIIAKYWSSLLYLDIYKIDSDDVVSELYSEDALYVHSKPRLMLQFEPRRMTILVRDNWTARDVCQLFGAIQYFGRFVRTVTMSASVFELLVAGMSSMDLTRWHAFQCYLKAINGNCLEDAVHVHCVKSNTETLLLPQLKELTIRVSPSEFSALSRLMDYGVTSKSIYTVNDLNLLRLSLPSFHTSTDSEDMYNRRRCNRHVKAFRHWADATLLQEKYCQNYC